MKRPTFFLSSTIYDFSDLRSAVKYFLEQQGCVVLASEYNDFSKPIEPHSYQACFEAILNADYFVLFIGSRVGGWYDPANFISITQQEYREAYKLQKSGKLKIINFVRSEVWQLKEDRVALIKYLIELDIDPGKKEQIANHPSKALSNAEFIINFINEVGRNEETKKALVGECEFPTGNWLHTFQTFKDIIDVLQTLVFLGQPIESAVLKKLLRREITQILSISLVKLKDGSIYSPKNTIDKFYREHSITTEIRDNPTILVNVKSWKAISFFAINLLAMRFHILILPQALSSTAFTNFNFESSSIQEEPVYEALFRLNEEIREFNSANNNDILSVVYANSPRSRGMKGDSIDIETVKLLSLLYLFNRWINIIELTKAILLYLDAKTFVMPELKKKSPIPEMNHELEAETITSEEIENIIKNI